MRPRATLARLRAILARRSAEQELREELDFHLAMQARKHRDAGADAAEANRRARVEFGNIELVKEDARDVRGGRVLEEIAADVRYGVRGLRRSPGFALAVILTIGLGVGINASAFTIFNAYVLRPFDVRDPYSLYSVGWIDRTGRGHEFSQRELDLLRGQSSPVADWVPYRTFALRLAGIAATGDAVSENFFNTTGVRSALGRTFVADDRSTPVVVLSYSAWQTRFGGDSSVVGRRILLRGNPFQVIGITQPGFAGFFKKPRDFWIPLGALDALDAIDGVQSAVISPDRERFTLLARCAPGVSSARLQALVATALRQSTADLPDTSRVAQVLVASRATPMSQSPTSYLAFIPLVLAFGLLLALACANVANMLLARGLSRQREIATRLALGAARSRLVRQLLCESVVLALPAAVVGSALSWGIVHSGSVRSSPRCRPISRHLSASYRCIRTGASSRSILRHGGVRADVRHCSVASCHALERGRRDARETCLGRTHLALARLAHRRSDHRGVAAADRCRNPRARSCASWPTRHRSSYSQRPFYRARGTIALRCARSVRTNRLVDALAATATLPLDMRFPSISATSAVDSTRIDAFYNRVSASYFDVLGIGIVNGRAFTRDEERGGAASLIISESAARRLFPAGSAIGQIVRLRLSSSDTVLERYRNARIVGIAKDVVVHSIEEGRERPVFYFPASVEAPGCCLLARARGDAATARRALDRDLERAVAGGVDRIDQLETFVAGAVYPYRAAYWISLTLGVIALGLTVIGVFGVVSYVVGQRVREIGVRIALGATTSDVLRLVLRRSLRQALMGAGFGAVLAIGVARVLAANVQSMPAFDAVAFASAFSCVVVACLAAAFLPSWRAATIDATLALRHD